MLSKLIVSEELDLKPGTRAANALKTYMTEDTAAVEAKGQEVETLPQCFACIFTTNHLPLWIEENDRRYWVVELEHDGRVGGDRMAEFTELVGNTKAYLAHDTHVARLYDFLMQRDLPKGFTGNAMNGAVHQTPIMTRIIGNGARTIEELLREFLDSEDIVAIPERHLVSYITGTLRGSVNQTKHLMSELQWTKDKVKWGSVDHARAVWLRPGHSLYRGKFLTPGRAEREVTEWQCVTEEHFLPVAKTADSEGDQ